MPRTISAEGRTITVPDDATDEEINQIFGPAPTAKAAPTPTAPKQGFFSSAADSSGLSGLTHTIAHPIDTAMGLPAALKGAYQQTAGNLGQAVSDYKSGNTAGALSHGISAIPILGQTLDKATDQYADKNYAGEAGTLTGLAGGLVAPAAVKALPVALQDLGETAQGIGANRLNTAAGMLKADFKRGANGGRAYLDAGGGPAMSMDSLATKAADLKSQVGQKIGDAREAATQAGVTISPQEVAGALNGPISKGISLENGPGGLGNTGSIEDYAASFRPQLGQAIANGGFTPNEVADLKSGISSNTNWSDPSQFNLKAIRQQNTGALSGLLSDKIPELVDLNKQYQGLGKFAARTASRAETGSSPLTSLAGKVIGSGVGSLAGIVEHNPLLAVGGALGGLALDSTAARTALASGIYKGGSALDTAGSLARPASLLPGSVVAPYNLIANKTKEKN